MERALGVVLQCGGRAERGHHCVADELLDRDAYRIDLRSHRIVELVEEESGTLGVLLRAELR